MNEDQFMRWVNDMLNNMTDWLMPKEENGGGFLRIEMFGDKDKIIISTDHGRFDYDRHTGEGTRS